jgi:adenosylcobinamide hydrolase
MGSDAVEATRRDGVLQITGPETRWLSTGWDGGVSTGGAAYNITVPTGWDETAVSAYVERRKHRAGFSAAGPALLTGVSLDHARCARLDSVTVYATVGLSNPAALPVEPTGDGPQRTDSRPDPGTVNLLVYTERALPMDALANLVATVAEAKTATLLPETGFTGTTSDAIVVGSAVDGEQAAFSGSATPVGAAARACVRDAIQASLGSRYPDDGYPEAVADADHGVRTDRTATVQDIDAIESTTPETDDHP